MTLASAVRAFPILLLLGTLGAMAAPVDSARHFQESWSLQARLQHPEGVAHAPGDWIAGKNRKGMPFTRTGKQIVKEDNAARNEGKTRCENCGTDTVPG